jgi:hypothetical protein
MTDETPITWRDWARGAWRSRMVWLNTIATVGAAALIEPNIREIVLEHVGPNWLAKIAAAVAALNIYLRARTSTPLPHR